MKMFAFSALMLAAPLVAETPAPPATPLPSVAPSDAKPRMVCRVSVDTGSLVKRTRRCLTAADWVRRASGESESARNLVRNSTGGIITQ